MLTNRFTTIVFGNYAICYTLIYFKNTDVLTLSWMFNKESKLRLGEICFTAIHN